jgi:uncharacterized protein YeeX (DUF496 family)
MTQKITTTLLMIAFFFVGSSLATYAQKSKDETRNQSRWQYSDDGLKRTVEIRGNAQFTDDYKDIRDVSPGGYVKIEEERDSDSRRYEVRRDSGGELSRSYFVNGKSRPIDQDARVWIANMVLQAVRQGGIDAEKRVQTILRQRGVAGVLEEIDQIHGDYAKRVYFEALIKFGNLDVAALRTILQKAAAQLTSDYEQAQLLISIGPTLTGKDAAMDAFFAAVATIKSDYEHGRVLKTVLKTNTQNKNLLLLVASSTKTIQSDYEKAEVLRQVASMYLDDPALREVFFQSIGAIKSDYEHRRVLTELIKNRNLSIEVLNHMLNSAASMDSDYEKASFLLEVSSTYTGDAKLKDAFLKVVETIKSDYERGRVLSALLKNKQIGE